MCYVAYFRLCECGHTGHPDHTLIVDKDRHAERYVCRRCTCSTDLTPSLPDRIRWPAEERLGINDPRVHSEGEGFITVPALRAAYAKILAHERA